jgi:hypothetical protein
MTAIGAMRQPERAPSSTARSCPRLSARALVVDVAHRVKQRVEIVDATQEVFGDFHRRHLALADQLSESPTR